jgi:hypothetical protein
MKRYTIFCSINICIHSQYSQAPNTPHKSIIIYIYFTRHTVRNIVHLSLLTHHHLYTPSTGTMFLTIPYSHHHTHTHAHPHTHTSKLSMFTIPVHPLSFLQSLWFPDITTQSSTHPYMAHCLPGFHQSTPTHTILSISFSAFSIHHSLSSL